MKQLIIIAVCFLILQCSKSPFTDLSGPAKLKGIAIIYDTLSGKTVVTPAKSIKLYLKYADGSGGYLTSTLADLQAQYAFNGIEPNKSYTVYASIDTGVVKYYGERKYNPGSFADGQHDTLKLFASEEVQNGIHLIVFDSAGSRLSNISAWVFMSSTAFASDLSAGKDFDMLTNENGVSNRYNVAPVTYYLRVKTQLANHLPLVGEANVSVPDKGIKTVVLTLTSTFSNRNGIELKVIDQYNTPVNGAVSYFYRTGSTFVADTSSYNNSLFKLTTNSAGLSSTYFVDSAIYFLRTIKVINTDTIRHVDTIIVNKKIISTKTIFLK